MPRHFIAGVILLLLPVLSVAQVFTCEDIVTVCLVGVETCCCQSPLTVVCQCCEPSELCFNGTCALASSSLTPTPSRTQSATPTRTSSPSPSVSPTQSTTPTRTPSATTEVAAACVQLDAETITCDGSLQGRVIAPSAGVTVVAGDLLLTDSTTLVVNVTSVAEPALRVRDGSVVVSGTIVVTVSEPVDAGTFVPLIGVSGDGSLDVRDNITLVVAGDGVPQPTRDCEVMRRDHQVSADGAQFGVIFTVDDTACQSDSRPTWTYEILVPVLALTLCCAACCAVAVAAVVAVVFWHRVRGRLWAHDGSLVEEQEQVVVAVRTSQVK